MRYKRKKGMYWLYFLYDYDEVIYVGVTTNLDNRLKAHSDKNFNRIAIKKYDYKADALSAERWYTIRYEPKHSWIPGHLLDHPELGVYKKRIASDPKVSSVK